MSILYPRSDEEKEDLKRSWERPDMDFFASGACHVLAAAFLSEYPDSGYSAFIIWPGLGLRGMHVFVANHETAFDWRGYSDRSSFLIQHSEAYRALFKGWDAEILPVHDPISWEFCNAYRHRHPSQFWTSPILRAQAFVRTFPLSTTS